MLNLCSCISDSKACRIGIRVSAGLHHGLHAATITPGWRRGGSRPACGTWPELGWYTTAGQPWSSCMPCPGPAWHSGTSLPPPCCTSTTQCHMSTQPARHATNHTTSHQDSHSRVTRTSAAEYEDGSAARLRQEQCNLWQISASSNKDSLWHKQHCTIAFGTLLTARKAACTR